MVFLGHKHLHFSVQPAQDKSLQTAAENWCLCLYFLLILMQFSAVLSQMLHEILTEIVPIGYDNHTLAFLVFIYDQCKQDYEKQQSLANCSRPSVFTMLQSV